MRPSLPGDLFVSQFIDFMKHHKIFLPQKFIRYFLSVRKFVQKFSSSSFWKFVWCEFFINFFAGLRMPLVLLEHFGLLSSVYNYILFDLECSVFLVSP